MEGVDLTVDEALASADSWMNGQTYYPGLRGWRVTCAVLAEEVRRLRAEVERIQQQAIETIHSQGVQLSDAKREIAQLRAENAALRESSRSLL